MTDLYYEYHRRGIGFSEFPVCQMKMGIFGLRGKRGA